MPRALAAPPAALATSPTIVTLQFDDGNADQLAAELSTLDLVQRGFVLLAGSEGGAWAQAGAADAEQLGIPLGVYRMGEGGGLQDPDGGFAKACGTEPTVPS